MVGVYPISEAYRRRQEDREAFADAAATDEKSTKNTIQRIFISVALMVMAVVFGIVFLWAYRKERALFVVVLSVTVFIYAILVLVFTLVQREKIDYIYFTLLIGSSAFMVVMMVLLIVIFSVITSQRLGSGDAMGSSVGTRPSMPYTETSPSYEPPSPPEY